MLRQFDCSPERANETFLRVRPPVFGRVGRRGRPFAGYREQPLSMEMSSFDASMPGAKATISIVSSVVPMLMGGNVPSRLERRLEGNPPNSVDI
jgi:hypothetical protein